MEISTADLKAKLAQHVKWNAGERGGKRLDLGGADLRGADLSGADLGGALFHGADLSGANLSGANLSGANLSGADLFDAKLTGADLSGLGIPYVPNIDAEILEALAGNPDHLNMDTWHTCETTHCRAGWAIVLAGKPGRDLEDRFGPAVAGMLIYTVSRPGQPIPNFYASNANALADLRESAAA